MVIPIAPVRKRSAPAYIGQLLGKALRIALYVGSPACSRAIRASARIRSLFDMLTALETIPVVSSKVALQLRRQPRMRSRT